MSLLDQLTQAITTQAAPQAAQKTGLDAGQLEKLMPMATAMMMSRLGKNAENPQAAEALNAALDRHQSNPASLADDTVIADGEKILGHVFGGQKNNAAQSLAKIGGIDQGQASNLMAMVAPMVMGALGQQKKQQGGFDVNQLAGLLGQERKNAQAAMPNDLNPLMKMLDSDGDGNVQNEIMGLGAKLMGNMFKR